MPRTSNTETLVRLGTLLLMAAIALPLACSDEHSETPTPAPMDGRIISVDGSGAGHRPVGDGAQRQPVDGRAFRDGAPIRVQRDGGQFVAIDGRPRVSVDGRGFFGGDGARFDFDAGNEDAGN